MARRPPVNREVVGLVEEWLAMARAGELQAVALVGRLPDGEYLEAWVAADVGDLACELRGTAIRVQFDA